MEKTLKILILEDEPAAAELSERELRKDKITFISKRVETEKTFLNALKDFEPDIILADFNLPTFDGNSALLIRNEKYPDIPFVIVSGTLGEDIAIEMLQSGATDYVLKNNLTRLAPAVRRAMKELKEREKRKQAEKELKKHRDNLEELVKERTKELEEKNAELDEAMKMFVGRELIIRKLKIRIRALEGKENE
jgi:DNA-binding NtrC family response regulator